MPPEACDFLSNMKYVSDRLPTVLTENDKSSFPRSLYIMTDNCTAAADLLTLLRPKGFRFFGTCFHVDGLSVIQDKIKTQWNPRNVDPGQEEQKAHLLLAELDMLRKGTIFLGTFHSNFARLVHYVFATVLVI